jgi:2-polyprenyl-3-methyl-5-hydroxy-6-metoxy-1,4-benzoquinol methylase
MALAVNYSRWILDRLKPFLGRHILEVGAGAGSFSQILLETGPASMTLLEPSANLFSLLNDRLPGIDSKGIAHAYPMTLIQAYAGANPPRQPDTAVYVNVLEHVEDDEEELRALYSILPSGGRLLIFVPANRWLMGSMDHQLGHHRRYTRHELTSKCRSAGFEIVSAEYFDLIGILPWWLKYCVLKSNHMEAGAVKLYDRLVVPISRILEGSITPPIGKSIILIAEKPHAEPDKTV